MFKSLSLSEFQTLRSQRTAVAVFQEFPGDKLTPVLAFQALGDKARGATLLESSLTGFLGRFSYLHFCPFLEIRAADNEVSVLREGKAERFKGDAFGVLRRFKNEMHNPASHVLSRFTGGLVGYFGYDCIRLFENIPDRHKDAAEVPEFMFRRYRDTVAFDHETGKVAVATLVLPAEGTSQGFRKAEQRLGEILAVLERAPRISRPSREAERPRNPFPPDAVPDDEAFKKQILKAKRYIRQGDVYQVVLSRRFEIGVKASPFDVYRALRLISPSPFMFFIDAGDVSLLGASPEKLVGLENGRLSISPLAGTRARGRDASDAELARELHADPKERAEHMMLVDLARNDVGAVARPGTVKLKDLMSVQTFSHVMHLSSTVEGELAQGLDALDALKAAFPAGTLTGAPKIRAMEIIDELETSKRGFYGGAVCAFDNQDNLTSCIAIRAALLKGGKAVIRAGAGIVADSLPQAEADETRHKARPVLEAVALAERGLA